MFENVIVVPLPQKQSNWYCIV